MDAKQDGLAELLKAAGPRTAVPAERAVRVRAAVEAHWRSRTRSAVRWPWALAASLATLAVAAALYVARAPAPPAAVATIEVVVGEPMLADGDQRVSVGASLAPGATLRTRPGELLALRLADGRGLRLAPGSALRVHEVRRAELLAGKIYLDSPPGTPGSLALESRFGTLTDHGTQYEAALGDDVAALRVRVREGRVVLDGARLDEQIARGEELTIDAVGGIARGRIAPTDPAWAWVATVAPAFALEGRSVDELVRWAARENGHRLRYDSPATEVLARSAVLHGSFDGAPPARLLDAVLPATRFVHAVDGEALVVSLRDEG